MVIIVMGVSGSGKTTIGRALANALHWGFSDADDFHPRENVEKMRSGVALTDDDREPWLDAIRATVEQWKREERGQVLACSALKESYREILGRDDPNVKFVYLHGDFDLISRRLGKRKSHFFNAALLRSQFETLEIPKNAVVVDISKKPAEIVETIIHAIRPRSGRELR